MEGMFAHLRQTRLYKFARNTWWIRTPLLTLWNAGFRCYFGLKRIVMRWQSFLGIVLWPFVGRGQEPPPTDPKLIAMLVFSDLAIDPRVEREARALVAGGYRVVVVAPKFHAAEPPDWGHGIVIKLCPIEAAYEINAFPWIFSIHMFRAAITVGPVAYHCHDAWTVLIGALAARRRGAKLVVDFHEYFSENVSDRLVPHRGLRKLVYQRLEKFALRRADVVITVCRSIAQDLQRVEPRRIELVRNIPAIGRVERPYPSLRDQLKIPDGLFVILYQGGVGPTRNLPPMIEALKLIPDAALVIRGPGMDYYGQEYRTLAAQLGVSERLFLAGPVPSADVVAAARGADAGIWSLVPVCKNFLYALPNKPFEYVAAGLPVLAAELPEVKREILDPGFGYGFAHSDPASIAVAVARLRADPEIHRRVRDARFEPDWPKLPAIYGALCTAPATVLMGSHTIQAEREIRL